MVGDRQPSCDGAQVWRIRDAAQVADLPIEGLVGVAFSPDGKWLMTTHPRAGSGPSAPGARPGNDRRYGLCFSPDGRLVVVQDASKVLRLVETETGRTLARLESPDLCERGLGDLQPRRVAPGGDHQ